LRISEFENAWDQSKRYIKDISINDSLTHIYADNYDLKILVTTDTGYIYLYRDDEKVAQVWSENVKAVE
jgi:hypothetical protein